MFVKERFITYTFIYFAFLTTQIFLEIIMRAFRTLLILSHRYIGIPLSFLFVVWFLSAFVMIYAGGMPRITEAMRIEGAPSLELEKVTISPWQAVGLLG